MLTKSERRKLEHPDSGVETARWTLATGLAIIFACYGLFGMEPGRFDKFAEKSQPAVSTTGRSAAPSPAAGSITAPAAFQRATKATR